MKKAVSASIVLLVAAILCVSASALAPQKIKKLHPEFSAELFEAALDGEAVDMADLGRLEAYPDSELEIVLAGVDTDLFYDQDGVPVNTADVTISKMRAAKMGVDSDFLSGGKFIKSAMLNVKNAGSPSAKPTLVVRFEAEYDSVHPTDFDAELVITIGGERQEESALRIAGTFGNPEVVVTSDSKTADSGKTVLIAGESIPSILVDAGNDVEVGISMREGERYLLSAKTGGDADVDWAEGNDDIVDIVKLNAAGFRVRQIHYVRIRSEETLYVYDENGKALGMTGDKLPFAETYYLADKSITL